MAPDVHRLVNAAWLTVGFYWLISALGSKRAVRRQSASSRRIHIVFATAAFILLMDDRIPWGALSGRFVTPSPFIAYLGLAITIMGCGLSLWARAFLGANWSATVVVKEDHDLIRRGPYAVIRHPIYSGFLLAMIGTALTVGEVRALIAIPLAFIGWYMKSRLEESFMIDQFGEQYLRYQREVKGLIPFVL